MARNNGDHNPAFKKSERATNSWFIRFPPWLITYSDLITLLLTFFILLLSMADLDPVRFSKASNSLKGALGLRPTPAGTEAIAPLFPAPPIKADRSGRLVISMIYNNLKREFEELGIEADGIKVFMPEVGTLLVRLDHSLLFNQDDDTLLPAGAAYLDAVSDNVEKLPIHIRIEGHSDENEIVRRFNNSWELSTARAVSVLRHLVQRGTIALERLSAIGYGTERPLVDSGSDIDDARNQRVDIILRTHFTSGTAPALQDRGKIPL